MKLSTEALGGVLRDGPFRNFWIAFLFSGIGDAMTKTALVWYVFEATRSPVAVGLLLLAYAGPVSVGGLVAGYLLDRFDRRRVMLADSLVRGVVVASVPIAAATGHLALWHVYVAAALYGFLFMVSLAGTPTLIPSLVRKDQLTAANSLETLGFTVSGVAGPALGGFLIAGFGAPFVLALDSLSYFVFAFVLARMTLRPEEKPADAGPKSSYRLIDAVRLMFRNRVLLSTTLMFMAFNAGEGFLLVWLPVHASAMASGDGAQLYGVLLTVLAAGEAIGALAAGSLTGPLSEGRLICGAQILAGLGLAVALLGQNVWSTVPALLLLGFFSGPMTAWAQTLRMRIVPPELLGRSFALLRTVMQVSGPAFSGIGGALLPLLGLTGMIGLSAALITLPGVAGTRVRELVGTGRKT
ncbi:MFS transporter [Amycolatopsis nigrescens]|uniref:MFS transporter n=1 Tax=Amycolatopsis nigrescens TaxID=381445 RepID=UPI00037BE738|nr:MFS transporter [Amycolatopsis nigrescens]